MNNANSKYQKIWKKYLYFRQMTSIKKKKKICEFKTPNIFENIAYLYFQQRKFKKKIIIIIIIIISWSVCIKRMPKGYIYGKGEEM